MALVLTRKKGERIAVGDFGWITVSEIRGDKVRLALDFPRDVELVREECLGRRRDPAPTKPETERISA